MRILEFFTVCILFVAILSFYFRPTRKCSWMKFLPLTGFILLLLTIIIEKLRWQMIAPAILILVIFIISIKRTLGVFGLAKIKEKPAKRYLQAVLSTLAVFLYVITIIPLFLFPVFTLPETTGHFKVGTRFLHLNDNRSEIYLQVWYPSDGESKAHKPYWLNARQKSRIFGQLTQTPGFMLSHLDLVKTNSLYKTGVIESSPPFPVLIYSPGYRMLHDQNSVLLEELASFGYIVFALTHHADTPFIDKDEETVKIFGMNPGLEQELDEKLIETTMKKLAENEDLADKKNIYLDMIKRFPKTLNELHTRVLDVRHLISRLEELNGQRGFLFEKMDLNRIGLLGMSLGGTTAILACMNDNRCKAGVSIDGFLLMEGFEQMNNFPSLLISSEQTAWVKDGRIFDPFDQFFALHSHGFCWRVGIKNTTHLNLTDLSLFGPFLRLTGALGKIKGRYCLQAQNEYIRLFFDEYLKNIKTADMSRLPEKYPDTEILYTGNQPRME